MSDAIIRAENLGKKYIIGHQQEGVYRYKALRDVFVDKAKSFGGKFLKSSSKKVFHPACEEFWALKDISFEVKQGDRVGIIGSNGAGKSTLLKILSRITEPSTGRISLKGRVASLLEVGTGFHPELTGRENIYLNGAILGMSKVEIKKKFDEIVDFAEVEKFLDTPVKRYSSGMYVRLAFAVAAHLEPEILIVDEVLAVGDIQFQKKCLGKMENVAEHEGRTVLFVSHNMAAIRQLCSSSILLEKGKIKAIGTPEQLSNSYINSELIDTGFVDLLNYHSRKGNQKVIFKWAKVCNASKNTCKEFSVGDNIQILFETTSENYSNLKVAIEIRTSDYIPLCNMIDVDSGFDSGLTKGVGIYNVTLKDIRLYPDTYYLSFWIGSKDNNTYDYIKDCLSFTITDGGKLTTRPLPRSAGIFFFTPEWKIEV